MNQPALPAEFLAHRYDPGHDAVHFVSAPRALRRSVPFLTDENLPSSAQPIVILRADALASAVPPVRLNFIFHSAYCCSTLLANAYDRPGAAFSLKEPVLLNDMVGWRHRGAAPTALSAVLGDALRLLARPFDPGEIGVIKPSNVVNGLIPAIAAARPEAGILLLHAPLKVYLGSIASKGLWGRRWVRDLLAKQLADDIVQLGFDQPDYFLQTDLQVAAIGWLAQHALFVQIARRWPDRVRTLDSETLLADPPSALAALDQLFGAEATPAMREAIVAEVFRRHAKSGSDFSVAHRAAGQESAAALHGEEIDLVLRWIQAVADGAGIGMELPAPLLG
ncbi:hypothetical protein [Sphingomonas sp.]|jgi:hypothetical protein|uniref:hypothetical protein n=1 Tax=Sphingomonas sp. TaxID=28214 RepID=UPI002D805CF0|nr:hypothetical protein [Sphingomonas sp.]HEU0043070.1 hypothetical protein [Sphingomonas sp.]